MAIATARGVEDPDAPLLAAALAAAGVEAASEVWNDPGVDWARYAMVVVRSTWDYTESVDEFLAWARGLARVENPAATLTYSSDKHYLTDLARRGHRVVASRVCDVGDEPVFPEGDFVVKPCVGAGSAGAARYGVDDHDAARAHVAALHARSRDVLIQPYVASVDAVGERALIFVDGRFSHAMTKAAMLNVAEADRHVAFRREQMSIAEPEPEALACADAVLADGGFDDLLYARVDLVATDAGWAVMELELVEPMLFLTYQPRAAATLAAAIARRLA